MCAETYRRGETQRVHNLQSYIGYGWLESIESLLEISSGRSDQEVSNNAIKEEYFLTALEAKRFDAIKKKDEDVLLL